MRCGYTQDKRRDWYHAYRMAIHEKNPQAWRELHIAFDSIGKANAAFYELSLFYIGRLRATCSASILFWRFRAKDSDTFSYIPPSGPLSQEGVSFSKLWYGKPASEINRSLVSPFVLLCNK